MTDRTFGNQSREPVNLPQPGELAAGIRGGGSRPRVLVIDDHPDVTQSLRQILEDRDYDVTEANTGIDAITAVRNSVAEKRPFSVATCDMIMGDQVMHGPEIVKRIKGIDETLPFIMIAGAMPLPKARVQEIGAVASYGKEVLLRMVDVQDELLTTIRKVGRQRLTT